MEQHCLVKELSFFYKGSKQALDSINLEVNKGEILALIGPSGCGKSTLLRCFNRMHDLYPGNRYEGQIFLGEKQVNILGNSVDPILLRSQIGMVFQKPNPFPKSIFENVVYGLRLQGHNNKSYLMEQCERVLRQAAIWDEVKDRLDELATSLSGGQQQRLCIARALAPKPEIILFDEPTSALDPTATSKVEDLIRKLRGEVTCVIVTHNMQQARRISDRIAFMYMGRLIEVSETSKFFEQPKEILSKDYVQGTFG